MRHQRSIRHLFVGIRDGVKWLPRWLNRLSVTRDRASNGLITLSFKEANRRLIFTTLPSPCPPKHRSAHISRKQTLSKASEKLIRSQLLERCVIYYLLIIALCIRPSYDDLSCCEIESCFAIDLWPCLFLLC